MENQTPTTTAPNEEKFHWRDMTDKQQGFVLLCYGYAMKTKKMHTLRRIFDLGNPSCVIGTNAETKRPYCRIDNESVDVMEILITSYLK